MGKKKEKDTFSGLMEVHIKENSKTIISMAKVCIVGLMGEYSKDRGRIIKCMAMGISYGLMEGNTKESTNKTKNMGRACFNGQTAEGTMGDGLMGSSTVSELIMRSMGVSDKGSGITERG